jgi:hypothetical protein
MSDSRKARGGCGTGAIVATVLLLPILYVLSSGPIFQLRENETISGQTYRTIYAPLVFVSDRLPAVRDAWGAYVHLWPN